MKHIRHIAALCAIALFTGVSVVATGSDNVRRKARYYYLEGVVQQTQGNNAEAHELYKRAYEIDTTYSEAASAYGASRLVATHDSLSTKSRRVESLELMRKFVDAYPGDMSESRYYAYVAARIGRLEDAIAVYRRLDTLFPTQSEVLLELADAYMAADSMPKAVAALDTYERRMGPSPQLSVRKISYMLGKKDTVGALKEADRMIAERKGEAPYSIIKGNVFEAIGMPDSARIYYQKAESIDPKSAAPKISLANLYRTQGDSAAYDEKMYDALLAEDLDLHEKVGLLAQYLQALVSNKSDMSRGDYLFSVLSEQYPHESEVLDLAARYSAAKGNYEEAIERISYALDMQPDNDMFWRQLMTYQIQGDKYKDAVASFDRASGHVEMDDDFKMLKVSALSLDSNYNAAINLVKGMITESVPGNNPDDSISDTRMRDRMTYEDLTKTATLYQMLGDAYYQAKELEKCYRAYDNALFFFSDSPMTLNNYAYFLVENGGDPERALSMIEKAISADSENATFLDTYAWVLFKLNRYSEALPIQEKAVRLSEEEKDTSAELYEHYGDILFMNQKPEEAVDNWKKALELKPGDKLLKRKVEMKTFFYE